MHQQTFTITNLTCAACVTLATKALQKIPGVARATVDLATGQSVIEADREIVWSEIVAALGTVEKTARQ